MTAKDLARIEEVLATAMAALDSMGFTTTGISARFVQPPHDRRYQVVIDGNGDLTCKAP